MRHLALTGLASAAVLVLTACEAARSTSPGAFGLRPSAVLSGPSGPGAFVTTGGADLVLTIPGEDLTYRYSFEARTEPNGSQTGTFEIKLDFGLAGSGTIHGDIVCFFILADGRRAQLLGRVAQTAGTPPATEGDLIEWRVVDNGEGQGSEPDQVSPTVFNLDFFECGPYIPGGELDVESGNVQVHPAQGSR